MKQSITRNNHIQAAPLPLHHPDAGQCSGAQPQTSRDLRIAHEETRGGGGGGGDGAEVVSNGLIDTRRLALEKLIQQINAALPAVAQCLLHHMTFMHFVMSTAHNAYPGSTSGK